MNGLVFSLLQLMQQTVECFKTESSTSLTTTAWDQLSGILNSDSCRRIIFPFPLHDHLVLLNISKKEPNKKKKKEKEQKRKQLTAIIIPYSEMLDYLTLNIPLMLLLQVEICVCLTSTNIIIVSVEWSTKMQARSQFSIGYTNMNIISIRLNSGSSTIKKTRNICNLHEKHELSSGYMKKNE